MHTAPRARTLRPSVRRAAFVVTLLLPAAAGAQGPSLVATFDTAWAAVSRTYWDTALVNGRWRAASDSLRALAAGATDEARIRDLVRALVAVPGQSHFVLIPRGVASPTLASRASDDQRPRVPGTTGLEVRMIGDTLVAWRVGKGSAAERGGVRAGDIILGVRGIGIDSLRAMARLSAPEGDAAQHRKLVNLLATQLLGGDTGDTVTVRLPGETTRQRFSWWPFGADRASSREVRLVRTPLDGQATKFGSLPAMMVRASGAPLPIPGAPSAAALVSFSAWFPAIMPQVDSLLFAARGASGVVLDLRGNPGGIVGMLAGVSGHFLDTAAALGTMRARGATIHFLANPRLVDRAGERREVIDAPLAILVDGFTGSTSEFFASGMQAIGRARVFGVPSAGEALPAVMTRLPNGDVLMHVVADHEDAKGRRVEGTGVQPDEVTPLTRADLRAGRDAALEAARAWIARVAKP